MLNPEIYAWLKNILYESSSLNAQPLKGGISSSVYLITFKTKPLFPKYVLRIFDNPIWLHEEPDLPIHEAKALQEAKKAGILAPQYIATANHEELGTPMLLMSFIEGRIDLGFKDVQNWLASLANELATIHQHRPKKFAWQFKSWVKKNEIVVPSWTQCPKAWEKAIDIVLEPPPEYQNVFLHRDYHPLNILWHRGKISGIVDWVNSCEGPAGVDVAHCRTNLMQMFGIECAEQFLKAYQLASPLFTYHTYWDIDSVLNLCWPKPEYYEPWKEFRIGCIEDKVRQERTDRYLKYLLANYQD